jgi:hypothetical protein
MINECITGDYADPGVILRIKHQCIPALARHRREILAGCFTGRHKRPAGFIGKKVADTQIIRRALAHAHNQVLAQAKSSNVFSFAAAARRRIVLAATA